VSAKKVKIVKKVTMLKREMTKVGPGAALPQFNDLTVQQFNEE
jgi:hypothetical protein